LRGRFGCRISRHRSGGAGGFALEAVGLLEHRPRRWGFCRAGSGARVGAIELLLQRDCCLLDEPTSGLDPGMQARLMEMLRGPLAARRHVVCTTHTLDTLNSLTVCWCWVEGSDCVGGHFGSPRELLPSFGGAHADGLVRQACSRMSGRAGEQRVAAEAEEATIAVRKRPQAAVFAPPRRRRGRSGSSSRRRWCQPHDGWG